MDEANSSEKQERFSSVDQLPDNPLAMPPPYWRSGGAIFQIVDALEVLARLLEQLPAIHQATETNLEVHFKEYDEVDDTNLDEFGLICEPLWELESRIKLKTDLAILMCAIELEDRINMLCVYNLHKYIVESVEKLSLPEKLLIVSTWLGHEIDKGGQIFQLITKITKWRNSYAHGHCVDRPTRSLRHNHLIKPAQYPGVPDQIHLMQEIVEGYLLLSDYMSNISLNPYTAGSTVHHDEIRHYLKEIKFYEFVLVGDSNDLYKISVKTTNPLKSHPEG